MSNDDNFVYKGVRNGVFNYKGYKGIWHNESEPGDYFYFVGEIEGLDPERYFFSGTLGIGFGDDRSLSELEYDFHETVDNYLESCKDKGIKPII
jgi:predicted HicB family RNase H-like nuclease